MTLRTKHASLWVSLWVSPWVALGLSLGLALALSACSGAPPPECEGCAPDAGGDAGVDAGTDAGTAPGAWVGSWTASMSDTGRGFQDMTLRQVVHLSVGGDRLRVKLSHVFGGRRARIGAASVGLQAEGSSLVPGSLRALTFGGEGAIELEPGAFLYSDPVALEVPARSSLVISLFLDGASGSSTVHSHARQTAYIAEGNQVEALEMPVGETSESWHWLTGVEIDEAAPPLAVVALGDSITDGAGSGLGTNTRYPDALARELARGGEEHAVLNAGIGGNRVLTDFPTGAGVGFGPSALSRFERDVLSQPGATHVLILEGVNDLGIGATLGATVSAEEVIAGYRSLISRAHERGLVVLFGTILPFRGATIEGYWTPENEESRAAINAWIRSAGEHDGVVDFDEAIRDPDDVEQLLPAFDSGDHLHLNDAGYQRMGEVAAEALRTL